MQRLNPQGRYNRDIALYGAIAFFGAIAANADYFPRGVVIWAGVISVTLIAIKAKLSDGKPTDKETKP